MPYLEDTDLSEMTNNSVFIPADNEVQSKDIEEPSASQPEPRRSTRSTRGQPPVRYGKVYNFGAKTSDASKQPWYEQTIFIPFNMNI